MSILYLVSLGAFAQESLEKEVLQLNSRKTSNPLSDKKKYYSNKSLKSLRTQEHQLL